MKLRLRCTTSIACALLVAACSSPDAAPTRTSATQATTPRTTVVETAAVRQGELVREWTAVGSLRANESVIVRPEVAGRVSRIDFDEGQRVARDATLITLDDSVVRAELASAQARLALSSRNAQRARELFTQQLIAPSERDTALAAEDVDKAAVRLAQAQMAKTRIISPFSGHAGLRSVAVGDYVNPGQDLVVLEDVDRMKLDFRLPELALPDLRDGQAVQFELDAYPGQTFSGQLYALDSHVDSQTRSIAARALIANADGRLRPGLFAKVRVVVERKADALLVPEQSIVSRGRQSFVYLVQDGKAVEREVRTGQRRAAEVEVLSGVAAGDQIVTSGLQKLADGMAVFRPTEKQSS